MSDERKVRKNRYKCCKDILALNAICNAIAAIHQEKHQSTHSHCQSQLRDFSDKRQASVFMVSSLSLGLTLHNQATLNLHCEEFSR